MRKLDNNQKVYVDLQKKDYIEPATEEVVIEEDTSFFGKILIEQEKTKYFLLLNVY